MDTAFDLADALQVARRRAWIVLVSVTAALAAAYGATQLISPRYEATATLFVGTNVSTDRGANDLQRASLAQSLAASYSELAETRAIAETAARSAGLEPDQIIGHVQSNAQPGLQILKVRAETGSPLVAERVANAVAHALMSQIDELNGDRRELGAEIVDPARSSAQPVSPRLLLNLVFGGLLGLLAGLGLAVARERLDQRIRTADDVERELGLPLLGVVPKFRRRFLRGEALARHANPEVAEPYRGIAAVLASSMRSGQSRGILITSACPEEGKTTVAAHLAVALAEDNRRVVLVEADLRRPSLRRHFPSDEAPTLNDVLFRTTDWRLPKSAQVCPGLAVVSADESPGDVALVLRAPEFQHALGAAHSDYDCVVLVGPPALPISDTTVLARHAESVLLVVRAGSSRVDDVRAAQAAFKRLGVHLAGVVLVGAHVPRRGRYSYGAAVHGSTSSRSARSPVQEVKPLGEANERVGSRVALMSSIALLVVAVSLGLVRTAGAQTYPPSRCELQLSTTRIVPGDTVRVEGCGFLPGTTVSFALLVRSGGIGHGGVRADRDGAFSTALEISEDTPCGEVVLEARGRGADKGPLILEAVLGAAGASCVPDEASAPSSGTDIRAGATPNTGINLALVAALGAALVAAGVGLWGIRRTQE